MKLVATVLLPFLVTAAFSQTPAPETVAQTPSATEQAKAHEVDQQEMTQRSAVEVKPGAPVIKRKDLWEGTGYFHPFSRLPRYIWQDQKAIWTSPFHTAKQDAKFWAIFGLATGALIATDRHFVKVLPNSSSQVSVSNWGSRLGSAYSLIPISAAFYFVGTPTHEERFRETGLICFEALIDSNIVVEGVKLVADRARPLESDGRGHFEDSPGGPWGSSFPSGHAVSTWAMASVIAHQYRHSKIVPILSYTLASTVVISRVGARKHFPGDVLAGSAMGWFIGDYVYGRRHNGDLEAKQTVAQKLLDRVHLGLELQ